MKRAIANVEVITANGYVLHATAVCEDGFDISVSLKNPPHRLVMSKDSHVMHIARGSIPRRAVGGRFTEEGLDAARALVLRMWAGQ